MKTITKKRIALCISTLFTISLLFTGCGGTKTNNASSSNNSSSQVINKASSNQSVSGKDTDGDGIPDTAEKLLGTNPHTADTDGDGIIDKVDKDPAFTPNLIVETSNTPLPVTINDKRVEDNSTSDHFEITLTNNGSTPLNSFDIYFTITDKVTNKQEGYYQKLTGLSINPSEKKAINFDNLVTQPGHFYGNMNGLYGTSKNGLVFDVYLHNSDYKPMNFKVEKAKGTAEVAD
jgi:archaellum component FlaF (FlaF/FlaG flagellin family)